MEIAIIGAGISGLAQYLYLRKLGLTSKNQITLYEARNSPNANIKQNIETFNASLIGASIGLSPTGLKVLRRLSQNLYDEVLHSGHVIRSWKLSAARGWTLASIPAGGEDEMMVMIGRERFRGILMGAVGEGSIVRRKVVDVRLCEGGGGPRVVFEDGDEENVDLVIAADGIWSVGRRVMFGGEGRERYEYSPQYEGLIGVGGFIPCTLLEDVPDGQMNVVNGANGFFGYGYCSCSDMDPTKHGETATWWSTYSLKECPEDWRNIDREAVMQELKRRHSNWKNKSIQNVVRNVEVDSLYPTFITPLLPTWEKGGCVLVGDAAHALQPSSGQGASMALEDCETLALLLQYHLERNDVSKALKQYSNIRRPRLAMVHKKAQELAGMKQDMNFLEEMVMYFFIWLFTRFKLNETYQKRLNGYDVPTEVAKALGSFQ